MIGTPKELIKQMLNLPEEKKYELKEYKPKRSLNANDYYWHLINEIANVLKANKNDIHSKMLEDYGVSVPVRIPAKADINGYARYYKLIGSTRKNGEAYKEYLLFKGSSEMNSKEFSMLLDGIIYEAKELDIETKTPNEIENLKTSWELERHNTN